MTSPWLGGALKFPLNGLKKLAIIVGTIMQNKEGTINSFISSIVDTFLPIQSIVVVTSPIGDQAPPALAAMIISPANQILSLFSGTSFLKIVTKTIVAVRLSMIAERMKARMHMIHSSERFLLVLMKRFIVEKPLK